MSETMLIYITAGSPEEARAIGRKLVETRLCACANVLDGATSYYWWEGTVQEETETVLIAKSRADLVDAVVEMVNDIHSYDCPCVAAIPIQKGNPIFLNWIANETG